MNDARDGRYWLEVFRRILLRKSVPEYVREVWGKGSFGLGSLWHEYIGCFSSRSDLRDQWCRYGGNGEGCAIEISTESLTAHSDGGKNHAWYRMLYEEEKQGAFAERIIDGAIRLARSEEMSHKDAETYWKQYAAFSFLTCGVRFKHPGFKEEEEWRVSKTTRDSRGVRYRSTASGPVGYLSLRLPPDMLTGIVRGPACSISHDQLESLLHASGYPINVMQC